MWKKTFEKQRKLKPHKARRADPSHTKSRQYMTACVTHITNAAHKV